jgi:hypothetical protein
MRGLRDAKSTYYSIRNAKQRLVRSVFGWVAGGETAFRVTSLLHHLILHASVVLNE